MKYWSACFSIFLLYSSSLVAQVQPGHTVILILENHSYSEIAGNTSAPYINSILNDPHTAVMAQSFALTHPSQPNYLMLFSGSNQGVTDDNVPSNLPFTAPNLGASLLQNAYTFIAYSETLPSVGYTGATSGAYARKHCPWVNWQGTGTNGIPAALNVPFTYFPTDFNMLPNLSFVIPNLNDDMHDGTIAEGDSWIQNNLDSYIQWGKKNNSLFILTFDEDDNSQSNQILTSITGEYIRGGIYNQQITHYNVLRTIEDLYKLPLIANSITSSDIQNIWLSAELCNNGNQTFTSGLSGINYQWQVNTGNGFTNISDNNYYMGATDSSLQLNNIPSTWYGYQYSCSVDGNNGDTVSLKFTDYWKGTTSTAWEDAANWSCGLPDSNTDVIVNSGTVLLNSDASVRSISFSPNANFNINTGKNIIINH
jgi:phosphatidylinositol-3-phosphatase